MISKKYKLRQNDFKKYLVKTKVLSGQHLHIRFLKTKLPEAHFSVVVPKKIAKTSVLRNKIKRRVYSVISKQIKKFPQGLLCVVFLRKGSPTLSFKNLQEELQALLEQIKI